MQALPINLSAAVDPPEPWDAIVIGTGVGGATVGYALSAQGLRVLFLEKGRFVDRELPPAGVETQESRRQRGGWPNLISERKADGRTQRFSAPLGCAAGGSSIFYAAALERMPRSDFGPLRSPTGERPPWPISYDDFQPYYQQAENIFGVGAERAEAQIARFSAWDRALMDAMRRNGLDPQPLQVAIRYDDECTECIGRICPRRCKADARTACLEVALRNPRCNILENCDVQRLEASQTSVRYVHASVAGQPARLSARIVVVAAGALHSPQLLLRSSSHEWPNGLANQSDQVGRNLMFHTSELFALWAPYRLDRRGRQKKALSVRDFYVHQGRRLGYVQSLGFEAGRGHIAAFLKDMLRRFGIRSETLLQLLVILPSHVAARAIGSASIYVAMCEDDPNPDNRIVLDSAEPDGAYFTYSITSDLRERARALREQFQKAIRPWRLMRLSPVLEMNYGHPCGTCRFGDDPETCVLDSDCKAHGISNLYVVDASFMPRSGAVNPSLTIAANALRVAGSIGKALSTATAK